MEAILEVLKPVLEGYVALFPSWVLAILLVIGSLRLVVKPLVAIVQSVVKATPSTSDDVAVEQVVNSKVYLAVVFVIDWIASIKLPKKEK